MSDGYTVPSSAHQAASFASTPNKGEDDDNNHNNNNASQIVQHFMLQL